jgi:TolA-binding protein
MRIGIVGTLLLGMLTTSPAISQTPASQEVKVVDLADLVPDERDMLDQAITFQKSGDPSRALLLLEDLLRIHPRGTLVEEALYRIALAYRQLGRFPEAQKTLQLRDQRHPQGIWRLPARLLQGEILAAEGQWTGARAPLVEASKSPQREISQRAHHLLILTAEQLRDLPSARASIEILAQDRAGNPHADFARLKLGTLAAAEGKASDAARAFKEVLAQAADPALRAEAAVRAGTLAQSRQEWAEAIANYETARRSEAPEFWKKLAHLGLVQSHFAAKDYNRALEIIRQVRPAFPDDARSQVLFLSAEAARLSGKTAEALESYEFFLKEFPNDPLAESALWARVLIRRAGADETPGSQKALAAEAARHLARFPQSPRRFQAALLRAEALYTLADYKASAPMLANLIVDKDLATLPPEGQAGLFYRAGHAAWMLKDAANARPPLTRLLQSHPQSPLIPAALWIDGAAALALNLKAQALTSWDTLLRDHPDYKERTTVYWQAALLAGNLERYPDMARLLQGYLQEFPQTPRAAEAHFLLGGALSRAADEQTSRPHWETARTLNPAAYFVPASQQLIRLALARQDVPGLRTLVDDYDAWRAKHPTTPAVALEVYEWLGEQLAGSASPSDAEAYLRIVLAASKDRAQRQRTQLRLALLLSALGNHGGAVREWSNYRLNFPEDAHRSTVLEPLARAHLGAGQLDQATALAEQILRQNPEGEFNARGRILLGEITLARGRPAEAAKIFSATALLIDDPILTPRALTHAEKAHRLSGRADAADAALLELKKRFPDYRE